MSAKVSRVKRANRHEYKPYEKVGNFGNVVNTAPGSSSSSLNVCARDSKKQNNEGAKKENKQNWETDKDGRLIGFEPSFQVTLSAADFKLARLWSMHLAELKKHDLMVCDHEGCDTTSPAFTSCPVAHPQPELERLSFNGRKQERDRAAAAAEMFKRANEETQRKNELLAQIQKSAKTEGAKAKAEQDDIMDMEREREREDNTIMSALAAIDANHRNPADSLTSRLLASKQIV